MWIYIPSNEIGNKGNPQGCTRADQEITTSNGKRAKELMIKEM